MSAPAHMGRSGYTLLYIRGVVCLDILFDEDQLLQLVTNLYVLTGLTANILDPKGRDIHLFEDHPPF